MENTNQKNTGNIQIAPVSAASDLNHKREGYLTWDEYFMGVAMLSGMRSKDPNSQVGACIVSDDNKILSMGYNGFPKGCSDDEFPWAREGEPLDTKYLYVTHSELNAILNYRGGSLEGAKIVCNSFCPAMSVPRQSSRQESRLCSMIVTNMQALRQSLRPRECWTPPVYAIINTREPDARFR